MRSEGGQATIEWIGLVLLVAARARGARRCSALHVDGRSFGGFLAHRIVCAVQGRLPGRRRRARARVRAARRRAGAPRRPRPRLRAGERRCRSTTRAAARGAAPTRPTTATSTRTARGAGERATVFIRLLRRGGRTYIQYWFYYPDSNTAWAGSDELWERSRLLPLVGQGGSRRPPLPRLPPRRLGGLPAPHRAGRATCWRAPPRTATTRAASSGSAATAGSAARGWTRVSRGSHAGHIPAASRDLRAALSPRCPGTCASAPHRRGPAADPAGAAWTARRYSPLDDGVKPPWRKRVYRDPEDPQLMRAV